jgi:hypothetical protein
MKSPSRVWAKIAPRGVRVIIGQFRHVNHHLKLDEASGSETGQTGRGGRDVIPHGSALRRLLDWIDTATRTVRAHRTFTENRGGAERKTLELRRRGWPRAAKSMLANLTRLRRSMADDRQRF